MIDDIFDGMGKIRKFYGPTCPPDNTCPACGEEEYTAEYINVGPALQQVEPKHCSACGYVQGDPIKPEHADLFGVRWTEDTPLAYDDRNDGRTIPLDEAETHEREYGPTGMTPSGPSYSTDYIVTLKDPNRIYRQDTRRTI